MEPLMQQEEQIEQPVQIEQTEQTEQATSYRLELSTMKGNYSFLPEQIIRLEAKSNYTRIFFSNHDPLITSKVLKNYEAVLGPHGFVRIHRSHLVNKNLIAEVDNKGRIVMNDMSTLEISRRKRSGVMKALRA